MSRLERKIAVIMPAYNAEKTIARAIESVIKQSHSDWRLYIIDDKSTDSTATVIARYLKDERISYIRNAQNIGAAEARNVGLRHAVEGIIAFIDSDGEWLPNKLSVQYEVIESGDSLVFGGYNYIKENKYLISYGAGYLSKKDFLKKKTRICFSTVCYKRCGSEVFFKKIGHEDFLFIFELYNKHKRARYISEPVANYYVVSNSLSSDKGRGAGWHWSLLGEIFEMNILKKTWYFLWYAVNGAIFSIKHK